VLGAEQSAVEVTRCLKIRRGSCDVVNAPNPSLDRLLARQCGPELGVLLL
jgi:hypothetical protein